MKKNLPLFINYSVTTKQSGNLFQILWLSQNIWTSLIKNNNFYFKGSANSFNRKKTHLYWNGSEKRTNIPLCTHCGNWKSTQTADFTLKIRLFIPDGTQQKSCGITAGSLWQWAVNIVHKMSLKIVIVSSVDWTEEMSEN